VYFLLAPVLVPLATEVTLALKEESQAVIDTQEQYEVFDNPHASDPTHSILAKDHVDLILNEPAGRVAQIVVEHVVGLVVHAWYDGDDDPEQTINEVLKSFFHPYYASGSSAIQNDMLDSIRQWLDDHTEDEREVMLSSLTKESVREGRNKRVASVASSSVDTLSSLEGSDEEYDSAYESHRSGSSPERRHSVRAEAPIERDRERYVEQRSRTRGEYKSILKNPQASEEARKQAREMLKSKQGEESVVLPRTSEAGRTSNASFTSFDDEGGDGSERYSDCYSDLGGTDGQEHRGSTTRWDSERHRNRSEEDAEYGRSGSEPEGSEYEDA
ncbi:hypothetical protein EW145_g8383, partial [Phellinidium pouzarii]